MTFKLPKSLHCSHYTTFFQSVVLLEKRRAHYTIKIGRGVQNTKSLTQSRVCLPNKIHTRKEKLPLNLGQKCSLRNKWMFKLVCALIFCPFFAIFQIGLIRLDRKESGKEGDGTEKNHNMYLESGHPKYNCATRSVRRQKKERRKMAKENIIPTSFTFSPSLAAANVVHFSQNESKHQNSSLNKYN